MPNLRKRTAVLTYNDDAVFRAIENLRKFSKNGTKPAKPHIVAKAEDKIPEVVYADDGREFFPCYFCCHAFAYKKDQLAHMQLCNFRDVAESTAPSSAKVNSPATIKSEVLNPDTFQNIAKVATSNAQRNLANSGTLMNVLAGKLQTIVSTKGAIVKAASNNRNGVSKSSVHLKVTTKKLASGLSVTTNASMKVPPTKIQSGISKFNGVKKQNAGKSIVLSRPTGGKKQQIKQSVKTKNKSINSSKLHPKQIVQNVKHGFNSTAQKNSKIISKKVQKAFPKIKVEPLFADQDTTFKKQKTHAIATSCVLCGAIFRSLADLSQHKRESHTFPRIRVSADKLKEYDEMYKNSNMNECTLCRKPVVKIRWSRHLLTHAEERNFPCRICNKDFGRSDHRNVHERKHVDLGDDVGNSQSS